MRVAVFGDIHGNLVGLEAAMADLRNEPVDLTVCLGDLAAGGPRPRESIHRVQELGVPVIMGNGDAWLFDWDDGAEIPVDSPARELHEIAGWCRSQLGADDLTYLRQLPSCFQLGEDLLCFHGSPRSYFEIITATTPDETLDQMFEGVSTRLLVGGHTHVQFFRRYRERVILNPGSVGLPHGRIRSRTPIRIPPVAGYAIIDLHAGGQRIDLRSVPVDLNRIRRSALDSDMPHAAWWAGRWG